MTTTTPVRETSGHPVEAVARRVRTTVAIGLVAVLILAAALTAFVHVPGLRAESGSALSSAVVDEIASLEATGSSCSTTPRLTDQVVVELADGSVSTMAMSKALDLTRDRAGVARAYCV